MTDTQQTPHHSGTPSGTPSDSQSGTNRDFSEADSRADAIAALAIVLILAGAALYYVAGI